MVGELADGHARVEPAGARHHVSGNARRTASGCTPGCACRSTAARQPASPTKQTAPGRQPPHESLDARGAVAVLVAGELLGADGARASRGRSCRSGRGATGGGRRGRASRCRRRARRARSGSRDARTRRRRRPSTGSGSARRRSSRIPGPTTSGSVLRRSTSTWSHSLRVDVVGAQVDDVEPGAHEHVAQVRRFPTRRRSDRGSRRRGTVPHLPLDHGEVRRRADRERVVQLHQRPWQPVRARCAGSSRAPIRRRARRAGTAAPRGRPARPVRRAPSRAPGEPLPPRRRARRPAAGGTGGGARRRTRDRRRSAPGRTASARSTARSRYRGFTGIAPFRGTRLVHRHGVAIHRRSHGRPAVTHDMNGELRIVDDVSTPSRTCGRSRAVVDRALRRRHRAGVPTRPSPVRPRLVRASTCGSATSAGCRSTTPTPTRAWPARCPARPRRAPRDPLDGATPATRSTRRPRRTTPCSRARSDRPGAPRARARRPHRVALPRVACARGDRPARGPEPSRCHAPARPAHLHLPGARAIRARRVHRRRRGQARGVRPRPRRRRRARGTRHCASVCIWLVDPAAAERTSSDGLTLRRIDCRVRDSHGARGRIAPGEQLARCARLVAAALHLVAICNAQLVRRSLTSPGYPARGRSLLASRLARCARLVAAALHLVRDRVTLELVRRSLRARIPGLAAVRCLASNYARCAAARRRRRRSMLQDGS